MILFCDFVLSFGPELLEAHQSSFVLPLCSMLGGRRKLRKTQWAVCRLVRLTCYHDRREQNYNVGDHMVCCRAVLSRCASGEERNVEWVFPCLAHSDDRRDKKTAQSLISNNHTLNLFASKNTPNLSPNKHNH
jgi:hypothetical protein